MRKHLLIFGSNGALGKGVTEVLIKKDYERIYLFDSKPNEIQGQYIEIILVGNLAEEANVIKAFSNIKPSKEIEYFLFSTVRGDRKSTRLNSSHLGISYAVF